jgi:hypothetical protein
VDRNKNKNWIQLTGPCPDLGNDRIVEFVVGRSGNMIARSQFGKVLRAERHGTWVAVPDISASGSNVLLNYYEEVGFIVYYGSQAVRIISEDFSEFRSEIISIPPTVTSFDFPSNGNPPMAVTRNGGVLTTADPGRIEFAFQSEFLILIWGPFGDLQRRLPKSGGHWNDVPDAANPHRIRMDVESEWFREALNNP